MQKILLYYKFVKISDPEAIRLWQLSLCQKLNLLGRIIISNHGINGTVGGSTKDLKAYIKSTKSYKPFKNMKYKWSDGDSSDFPKLSVRVKDEIVTFGISNQIKVNDRGIINNGKRIKPEKIDDLIKEKGEKQIIFFDGRNNFESKIGNFKNSIKPNVEHSRYFKDEIKKPKYNKLKDKTVITYCTGGIRCEVLTHLMKENGFKDVYQIDGGIVKYGEKYKDQGLWQGKLFVFDKRMNIKFSSKAKDIAKCNFCPNKTSNYENCLNKACNKLILICKKCLLSGSINCQNCNQLAVV